jgi:hypothetical protein
MHESVGLDLYFSKKEEGDIDDLSLIFAKSAFLMFLAAIFKSKTTGTATSRRILTLLRSHLSGLAYTHCLTARVYFSVGASKLNASRGSATSPLPFTLSIFFCFVLLIQNLFDGLLADAIVTKVVKLLKLVVKFSMLHFLVDCCY